MITQPYQRLQELSWKKPVSSNAPASSNITQEVFPLTDHQKIMQEIIPAKLKEIEFRENIRIIHCIESGSRAWGFASPDSDYDVRFIYVRSPEYYLRLDKTRDVIEWQLDDTLDINGWDLQKALRLLHKSNPTLFEWNSSPIVYKTTPEWAEISAVINRVFQKKAGLYHYLSTAKTNYREYLRGDMVKLKKYFYVLRPILACRWILEKQTPPPMLFSELAVACLEGALVPAVTDLLRLEMETPELGVGPRIDVINDYLDASIEEVEQLILTLPPDDKDSWEELNRLFLKIVGLSSTL
jgi:predicted nucleotidyltransferase